MIIEKIHIEKISSEEIAETKTKSFNELIEILESNNPDSSYFFDVRLSALLDYLYEAGYSNDEILKLNNNYYGNFINFYYLKDYNIYMMELGMNWIKKKA